MKKYILKLQSNRSKAILTGLITVLMLAGLSFDFYQNEYLKTRNYNSKPKQEDIATTIPKKDVEVAPSEESPKSDPAKQSATTRTASSKASKIKASSHDIDGALLYSQLNFSTISSNELPDAKICDQSNKQTKLNEEYDRYITELAQINKEYNDSLDLLSSQFSPSDAPNEENDQKIWAEIDALSEETKAKISAAEAKFQANYKAIENGCY